MFCKKTLSLFTAVILICSLFLCTVAYAQDSMVNGIRIDTPTSITGWNIYTVSGEILIPSPVPENTMLIYAINGVGSNPSFGETGYMFNPSPLFAFDPGTLETVNPDGLYLVQVYLVDMITGDFLAFGEREVQFTRLPPEAS